MALAEDFIDEELGRDAAAFVVSDGFVDQVLIGIFPEEFAEVLEGEIDVKIDDDITEVKQEVAGLLRQGGQNGFVLSFE